MAIHPIHYLPREIDLLPHLLSAVIWATPVLSARVWSRMPRLGARVGLGDRQERGARTALIGHGTSQVNSFLTLTHGLLVLLTPDTRDPYEGLTL